MYHSEDKDSEDERRTKLSIWLKQPTYREERRFLEAHPELLDPSSDHILTTLIAQLIDHKEIVGELHNHLELLRDVRTREGSERAIRAVYVDRYGGLVLDLPPWLEAVERQLAILSEVEPSDQVATEREQLLRRAIVQAQSDSGLAPEMLAELQLELGNTLRAFSSTNHTRAYETAIEAYQRALQVYTLAHYPRRHTWIQYNLGNLYSEHTIREQRTNLDYAIICYEAALYVCVIEAIREAYVNLYGGFTLDLPNWLEAREHQLNLRSSGEAAFERVALLREAIVPPYQEPGSAQEILAELNRLLFAEAATVIERGRARGLAESIALDTAHPDLIQKPAHRTRYEHARRELIAA